MRTIQLFAIISCFTTYPAIAQTPPAADQVMAEAGTKAAAGHKAIFVHFGASWCGWCRKLDTFLDDPAIKPVFERYFVTVKLDVMETDAEHKKLENAGADVLMKKLGGTNSGLPFHAFVNAKGELIVNAMEESPGHVSMAIGYPNQPNEIVWFLSMVKKAAPDISTGELKTIEDWLKSHKS